MAQGTRHLSTSKLLEHWHSDVAVLIPLPGTPEARLLIDRPSRRLTLRIPIAAQQTPPANPLAHVDVRVVSRDAEKVLEVSITDERLLLDGYAMLSTISDRVQLEAADPIAALSETLTKWRTVLALRTRMTPEREVGLFGELLIVGQILQTASDPKLDSWRGSLSEEHDFGFAGFDLEIKTTTGERREHWIHGVGQLMPTDDRPLWLVSLQLTRAGTGDGETLPQLVSRLADHSTASEDAVRRGSESAGYHVEQADLFGDRWRMRTAPLALLVDDEFPRITPSALIAAEIQTERIRDLTYRVDLTDLPPGSDPPSPLPELLDMSSPR